MNKGTRSAKGVIVDFDLMRIKEQIANAPRSVEVTTRETFIDQKFKRRLKRTITDVKASVSQSPTIVDPLPPTHVVETPVVEPETPVAKKPGKL